MIMERTLPVSSINYALAYGLILHHVHGPVLFHSCMPNIHSSPKEVYIDFTQFSQWPRVKDPDPSSFRICQMVLFSR